MTTLFVIVALLVGGLGVYFVHKYPKLATPLLVGAAIITLLYIMWDHDPSSPWVDAPPAVPTVQNQVPMTGPPASPAQTCAVPGSPTSPVPMTGPPTQPAATCTHSLSSTADPTVSLYPGK